MKKIMQAVKTCFSQNVIARFGAAELVQNSGGKLQVRGGSKSEQAEAREWVSFFRHDAIWQTKW